MAKAKLDYSSLDAYKESKKVLVEEVKKQMAEEGIPAAEEKQEQKKLEVPEITEKEEAKPEAPAVPEIQEQPDSQTKAEEAKKKLEDYLQSEERKQNAKERAEKQRQDMIAQQLLYGLDGQVPAMEPDKQEEALRAELQHWEQTAQKEKEENTLAQDLAVIAEMSEEDKTALNNYVLNKQSAFISSLSPMATGLPADYESNPLIEKYGRERLDQLAESYKKNQNREKLAEAEQKGREHADKNLLSNIFANAGSIGANLADTLLSPMGRISEMAIPSTGRYTGLRENAGDAARMYAQGVRGQTAENIAGDVYDENGQLVQDGGKLRQIGSLAYQGGMSLADSMARYYLMGGPNATAVVDGKAIASPLASGLAALGSFNTTLADASAKGATTGEALALATATAGIEALTEKLPLDNLLNIAKGTASPSFILNTLKQIGIEIGEEEASFIGTTLAEMAILKEKSSYHQDIARQAAMGVPYEQAKAAADKALLDEAANIAATSGFSGLFGGMGAGATTKVSNYLTNRTQTAQQTETTQQEQTHAQTEQTVQEAPEQPQPIQKLQTAPATEKPAAPNTIDVLTETITGKPTAASQTSTQQVDTQNQSVESGQIKGTGAAEQNFSGVAEYENMLYDGNIQKQRAGAVRDVEMPQTDPEGRRVSSLASNAVSAAVTPDRMVDAIKSLVNDRELSFDTRSNQQSLDNAAEAIRQAGEEKTINELAKHAENKTIVDGDVEKGLVLYAQYANDPNAQEKASEIFTNLAAVANMSGRNLQLFGLLKRMTPEGQLMTVRKEISKSIEKINKSRHGKNQITVTFGEKDIADAKKVAQKRNVQVDKALEQNFLDAKTIEEKKQALDDIYKDVAAKIKPTLGEMYDEWRNFAMLGNLKTHERNVGATAAFQPFVMVKRAIGSALESAILKQEDRTKSIVGFGKDDRALVKWARGDAKSDDIKKLLGGSGFAGNEARDTIQEYRKILPGFLDTLSKGNQNVMGAEDTFFKRGEYAASLASFLKARGYSIEQVQEGSVPKGIMDEGRQIAIKEAQKATFNDRNKLTNLVEKLNNAGEEYGGSVFHALSKGAVPFLRTTTNIVKRASEYSFDPVSIGKTLITAKADIDSGQKSGADVIDEISARLTGGAAMALGAGLAAGMIPGIELVGEIEDEDELREGAKEYSVRIGDKYYPVGWLAPVMIPLFIGANLYGKFSDWDEDADGWDLVEAYIDTMKGALNPLLELSMLSSINDMIDAVKYEEKPGGKVVAAVMNLATSYFTQSIPTVFGQVEQAFEEDKKTAYVNTGNTSENIVKRTIANATKRLPGDAYQTEKLDEFGQPVKNDGDPLKRVVDAFLNPFNTSERKTDAVTKEITRLNRENVGKVKLSEPSKKITYTDINGNEHEDVRLTEEQYQTMARTQGDTEKRIMEQIIESDVYKAMTDRQKADLLNIIDDYARESGRVAALEDYDGMSSWMKDLTEENEVKTIIGKAIEKGFDSAFSDIVDDWNRGNDTAGSIEALDQAYKNYKAMPEADRLEFVQNDNSRVGDYIRARNMGVDAETYAELYKKYRDIDDSNKKTGDKADDWSFALEDAVDRKMITERQKNRMKADMFFSYQNKATTEKFDQMVGVGVDKNLARTTDKKMSEAGTSNKAQYATIAGLNATDETKDAIMKVYMTDFDPKAKKVDTTELKYDYIRKEMGLNPSQFSTAYSINNEGGKWKDRASKMSKQLKISKDKAYDLIQIFEGKKKDMLLDWYKQQ